MGATLDSLMNMVKDSVMQHTADQRGNGFDPSKLLGHIEEIFGQHARQQQGGSGNVRPASEDRYGDPADGPSGAATSRVRDNVKPASQDPYGDPADESNRGNRKA